MGYSLPSRGMPAHRVQGTVPGLVQDITTIMGKRASHTAIMLNIHRNSRILDILLETIRSRASRRSSCRIRIRCFNLGSLGRRRRVHDPSRGSTLLSILRIMTMTTMARRQVRGMRRRTSLRPRPLFVTRSTVPTCTTQTPIEVISSKPRRRFPNFLLPNPSQAQMDSPPLRHIWRRSTLGISTRTTSRPAPHRPVHLMARAHRHLISLCQVTTKHPCRAMVVVVDLEVQVLRK